MADRARLAEMLLQSLDALSEEELGQRWAEEAARRDAKLSASPSLGRASEDAFRDLGARMR